MKTVKILGGLRLNLLRIRLTKKIKNESVAKTKKIKAAKKRKARKIW